MKTFLNGQEVDITLLQGALTFNVLFLPEFYHYLHHCTFALGTISLTLTWKGILPTTHFLKVLQPFILKRDLPRRFT